MRHEHAQPPIILLLDGSLSADNSFVKRWFQKSRFLTCEANDIFQALEEISDFTNRQRPNVVLLEVKSMPEDFRVVKMMIQTPSGQDETPILAFSETEKSVQDLECFAGNLALLEARLNLMFPDCSETKQAIAA